MAYQISRADRLIDEIELVSKSGEVKAVLTVNLDVTRIARSYRTNMLAISKAQENVRQMKPCSDNFDQAVEELGNATIAAYNLVFGEENTAVMLEFFENEYLEMLEQTMPFIFDVVQPAVQAYVQRQKNNVKSKYKVKNALFAARNA